MFLKVLGPFISPLSVSPYDASLTLLTTAIAEDQHILVPLSLNLAFLSTQTAHLESTQHVKKQTHHLSKDEFTIFNSRSKLWHNRDSKSPSIHLFSITSVHKFLLQSISCFLAPTWDCCNSLQIVIPASSLSPCQPIPHAPSRQIFLKDLFIHITVHAVLSPVYLLKPYRFFWAQLGPLYPKISMVWYDRNNIAFRVIWTWVWRNIGLQFTSQVTWKWRQRNVLFFLIHYGRRCLYHQI